MVPFIFGAMMPLLISYFKLSFKITARLSKSNVSLAPPDIHPGDIFHPDFANSRPTYFDISVRNSLLPQFLNQASFTAGVASSTGEVAKDAKYDHNVSSTGNAFFPLVVETLGL